MVHDDPELALAKLSALSPAEQAVLDQALTGAPAREIAERLSVSEATVRSHLSSIYVKLGVSGRVALLASFRGTEAPTKIQGVTAGGDRLPAAVRIVGWSWIAVAAAIGIYATNLLGWVLSYGMTPSNWQLLIVAIGLDIVTLLVATSVLAKASRARLARSIGLAVAYLGVAGIGLVASRLSAQPFLVLAAVAFAIGWISFRARQALPPSLP